MSRYQYRCTNCSRDFVADSLQPVVCPFCQSQQAPPLLGTAPAPPSQAGNQSITPDVVRALRGTRPWVLFLSILGFISTAGLAVFGMGREAPIFGVFAAIYVIQALLLFSYSSAISRFTDSQSPASLARALEAQKTYWLCMGVFAIAGISLIVLGFLLMYVVGGRGPTSMLHHLGRPW